MRAEHERIRATAFHPQGTFLAIPADELDQSLLTRFAQMVEHFPDHLAVQAGKRSLTYRQLDTAANRVAQALLAASGTEPCAIALLFGMESEWIVATLAVWKAGKFWVALDLRHPPARLTAILEDAQTPLILTSTRHAEVATALAGTARQWLAVDALLADSASDSALDALPIHPPMVAVEPTSYAYLVYTSGSTGRPKGVIENHTNILHMIAERGGLVHPSSADRIALLLPPAAGGAIYNIVLALWYGAALLLFEFAEEGVSRFEDWLLAEGITGMHAGVVLRTWLPTLDGSRQFPALRFLLLGAAPVYREHVTAFQRFIGGGCMLVNPYSSAEVRAASLFAMDHSTTLSSQIIPVGYPPPWVRFEIWGEEGKSLPAGVTGEVVIFTEYMTPGYWRQPELSVTVFGVDQVGRRYYRSGDVGRLDADGCLWILGRKDRQIKIRGHRVEPAEVEVELLNVAGVREAAVVAEGVRDDEIFLAAYVTLEPESLLSVTELHRGIAARLPHYMVPRQVTVLETLPRNGYGKVDRPHLRAHAAMQRQGFEREAKVLTMTPNSTSIISGNIPVSSPINFPEESIILDGEVLIRHAKVNPRYLHPTGEYIPITTAEIEFSVLHLWERMVERFADKRALEEGDCVITYRELNTLTNRIAHVILARKVPHDLPVALLFDIESDLYVGILAVWKAGNFLIGMEPHQPLARNQFIVEDSGARLVITNHKYAELAHQLWGGPDQVIVIEDLPDDLPIYDPPLAISGADTAYLLYTSGSTGRPKGTVENHRNLMAMMAVRQGVFHFSNEDRICIVGLSSWCFSACAAFMYGGCLLPFRMKEEGLAKFSQFLIDRRITMVSSGAVMRLWLLSLDGSQQFPDLRVINLGAGPSYLEHLQAFQRYLGEHCILVNTYSATECRSVSLLVMEEHTRIETRLIPAGFPTLRGAIEIWGDNDKPLPVGVAGEIIAITPFTAVGYWRSPELTAARFGVDAQGRRYYRTGDLGRLDEHGCLWVLGRKDSQVKIRGYRVETAEVEVALLELPNVQEAAVIQMGESDEARYLMAFVACPVETSGLELRQQLATRLPDYMVPSTVLVLEELPHNTNGKVARPLLREMAVAFNKNAREVSRQPETAARTETETRVVTLMNELLASNHGDSSNASTNDPAVGLHDNFFEVGGHSLLAARLMLQIHRTFGVDLAPRDFIAEPTAVALARAIDQRRSQQRSQAQEARRQRPLRIEAMQMVNGSDDHAPIFLCLGGNGSQVVLLRYQKLIRRLGKQWHLYGLVTTENDDPDGLYRNMEELVNEAMAALRRVRPRGPYLLIGECLGGKLAFELARALEKEGERTLLLTLLDAGLKRNTADNFSAKSWQERFAYHQAKMAGMGWQGGARYLWDRFVARLPSAIYPYPTEHRGHIAQKRYFDVLHDFEPNQGYLHPVIGIYTRDNQCHLPLWKELIPRFDLTMVEGTHQEYMYLSGDEVVTTLRSALARVEDASKGTLAKGAPLAKPDAGAVLSLPG